MAVCAQCCQVFLRRRWLGVVKQPGAQNTLNRQAQVGHRDRVALGDEAATVAGFGAQLGYRGLNVVGSCANGSARAQDQVSRGEVHRAGVCAQVQDAAGRGNDRHLCCGRARCAGADFAQGDVACSGFQAHVAVIALGQRTVCHADGVIGLEVNGLATGTGKDVACRGALHDAVFGQQGDVAAGAAHAGVEGDGGINQGASCIAHTHFARTEQDVARCADAYCVGTAAHGDGAVGGDKHQVAVCAQCCQVFLRCINHSLGYICV